MMYRTVPAAPNTASALDASTSESLLRATAHVAAPLPRSSRSVPKRSLPPAFEPNGKGVLWVLYLVLLIGLAAVGAVVYMTFSPVG